MFELVLDMGFEEVDLALVEDGLVVVEGGAEPLSALDGVNRAVGELKYFEGRQLAHLRGNGLEQVF